MGDYFSDVINRIELQSSQYEGSGVILLIILLMTIGAMFWLLHYKWKLPFFKRKTLGNGMQRLKIYDTAIYFNVLSFFGIALGCFICAILVVALFGAVTWLITWVIKIVFIIIVWVGIIGTIIGVLGIIGGEGEAALALVVGIPILLFKNTLTEWGESIVEWSFDLLQRINMIGFGYDMFVNLWDVVLFVFMAPVGLFLLMALLIIITNSALNGFEWIVTKIYSIRRPCPVCGSTKTPNYIVDGKIHPVTLHPGMYGIFSQYSPATGKRIPTMLFNGKGKLDRKCSNPNCGAIIHSDANEAYGTDVHIGFVGHRSSGKSYLLYSGLSVLKSSYSAEIRQVDMDQDTKIEDKKKRIDAEQGIQTNVANKYRAVQLMISSKTRRIPYHAFFYDVAGEKFNAQSTSYKTAMEFYRNVQSVVFIIDPSMVDYMALPAASEQIKSWAQKQSGSNGEKYRIDNSFSVLKDILESVGRKSEKIDFSFVCTKSDMGYFEAVQMNPNNLSEQSIRKFIYSYLGLGNLVVSAEAAFHSVHFFEINVKDTSKLKRLFLFLLKQRGVSIS